MRYTLGGYAPGSYEGERYRREKEHNYWHDEIEGALRVYLPARALALLRLYFDDSGLHDDNIPLADAEDYL